jgi:hypothetical protein
MTFASWSQFKHDVLIELFDDGRFRPNHYLFRGMGNADYRLCSAFDRRFSSLPEGRRLMLWKALTTEWRASCEEAGVSRDVLADEHKLLALGQHHGLPTRLLDWSTSPYVAAFFAFNGFLTQPPGEAQDVAVWVLHVNHEAWSGEGGVEIISAPSLGNVRMRNQSGRFTVARTPFPSLEEYVAQFDCSSPSLSKCLLPATDANSALADLDAMGINCHHLFPDLGGLAGLVTMRVTVENAFADWLP